MGFFIFDFDYTLADSSRGVIECVNFALTEMGLKAAPDQAICRTIGLTLEQAFIELAGQPQSPSSLTEFKTLFVKRADEVMADYTLLFEPVSNALTQLKNKGNLLGIVSTKFRYRIETILKREQILDLFDIIIGGEDVANHKPDPEGVLKAVATLNVPLSNGFFIGDSLTDAATAQNAGIEFIASLTGATTQKEFNSYKVKQFINDISELVNFIEGDFHEKNRSAMV